MSTDDSKYFKSRNHHVALMSTFDSCDTGDWSTANFVYPTCHLLTPAKNQVKSSNAAVNAKVLINEVGLEAAAYLGGGTTDNAWDALSESDDSFHDVIQEVNSCGVESIL